MSDYFNQLAPIWDQEQYRVDRAAAIATQMKTHIAMSPTWQVLEFGCGTGLLGFNLVDHVGQITFADTAAAMLAQVRAKVTPEQASKISTLDLSQQPLAGTYDLIVSLLALHHIEDVPGQIALLAQALRPGGQICLCDLDTEDGSFHTKEVVPHNGFERSAIQAMLQDSGIQCTTSCTGFVNHKVVEGKERDYPVFMIFGQKPAA